MKAIAILMDADGEEWFMGYGPPTKERNQAIEFASEEVARRAAINHFGRGGIGFWESERRAEKLAFEKYKKWAFRVETVKKVEKVES